MTSKSFINRKARCRYNAENVTAMVLQCCSSDEVSSVSNRFKTLTEEHEEAVFRFRFALLSYLWEIWLGFPPVLDP